MAVEELEPPSFRKRKRGYEGKRLIVNDKVEVRSMEEGFLGSWHPGTVLQCGKLKRRIRYDNLVDDSGSDNIVDIVAVPAILDGDTSQIYNERGYIRPVPPKEKFGEWNLPFGLCVDVFHEEAWWEGVIFDHYNGERERSIFFPDLGDEMSIPIYRLRITHDWNEVTGEWKRRGMWVFLESVEKCERDGYVAVSIKQIWYDVRAKKDFNKIADWTCNVKKLWRDLVLEVIKDYFELTVREISIRLGISKDPLVEAREPESSEDAADIDIIPERISDNFDSDSNSDKQFIKSNVLYDAGPGNALVHDLSLAENHFEKGDLSNFLDAGKEGLVQQESISPEEEISPDSEGTSGQDDSIVSEENYGAGSYKRNRQGGSSTRKTSNDWKQLMISGVKLCPESVHQYALKYNRIRNSEQLLTDIRKHILCLGWKIEYIERTSIQRQYRYTSPEIEGERVVYMTLRQVCQHIVRDTNVVSLRSPEDQRSTYSIDNNISRPAILPPPSVKDIVETKSCPEAVLRYYLHPITRDLSNASKLLRAEAKKHLTAEGWNIESPTIERRAMIYISPQNQRFTSLRLACKECIKESIPKWISSGMIPLDISSVNEESSGLVNSDSFLCCVSQLLRKEPELFSVNGAPASRSIVEYKPKRLRKLKSQDKQRRVYSTTDNSTSLPAILPVGVVFEPKYCPEAVLTYYSYSLKTISGDVKKNMILKARKHLSAEGWNFKRHIIQRQGMIYISPRNQRFGSLRVACRACIKECLPKWIRSGMKPVDGLDINEEKISQFDCDQLSRYVSKLLSKEPELSVLNRVPESRSTGHCKSKPSRNLNSRSPKRQRKRLPIRLLRSSKRVQKVRAPCPSNMKAQNVLSWLIDCNKLLPRSKVHYHARRTGRPMVGGRIARDGIKCICCQQLYSLGGFEGHATGQRNCRSAAANIVLENGKSLLDLQRQIMNEHRTRETTKTPSKSVYQEENDGICSVCHYGGELILCDNCPSSFHKSCISLEDIPEGDWFCPTCCCGICCQSKTEGGDDEKLLTCSQCEHKYHAKCLGKRSVATSGRHVKNWFCGESCERIYAGLHRLLGEPVAMGVDNLNWTLLKVVDSESCDIENGRNDLEVESYSKLNVALAVMHECFEPLKESYSGRDLVEDVIFSRWSKLNRLNFQGFYTVLLEKDEEVVTVATVRVYGEKVAEVPLVGTRFQYRRLGMCRILMDELEKRLKQLGIERIVLPAVPSVLETWTTSFGFTKMTNSERSQFLDCTFLDFQDTVMCQKVLIKTRPALVLSTEIHTKTFDHQSSVVSEDQAEEIDKNETQDLQIVDDFAGNDDNLCNDAPNPVHSAEPANSSKGQQLQNSSEGQQSQNQNAARCMTYKRRKSILKTENSHLIGGH